MSFNNEWNWFELTEMRMICEKSDMMVFRVFFKAFVVKQVFSHAFVWLNLDRDYKIGSQMARFEYC